VNPPKKKNPKKRNTPYYLALSFLYPIMVLDRTPPGGGVLNELVTEDGMAYTVLEV